MSPRKQETFGEESGLSELKGDNHNTWISNKITTFIREVRTKYYPRLIRVGVNHGYDVKLLAYPDKYEAWNSFKLVKITSKFMFTGVIVWLYPIE
jgi:hypothetical protein